jgi:hypothetical protein
MDFKKITTAIVFFAMLASQSFAGGKPMTMKQALAIQETIGKMAPDDFASFKRQYAKFLREKHVRFIYDLQRLTDEEIRSAIETIKIGESFNINTDDAKIGRVSSVVSGVVTDPEKKFLLFDTYLDLKSDEAVSRHRLEAIMMLSAGALSITAGSASWMSGKFLMENMKLKFKIMFISLLCGMPLTYFGWHKLNEPDPHQKINEEQAILINFLKQRSDSMLEILAARAYLNIR